MMLVRTHQGLRKARERLAADWSTTDFHPWCNAGCVRSARPCAVPCSFVEPDATRPSDAPLLAWMEAAQ
jgi:hypothetical protein